METCLFTQGPIRSIWAGTSKSRKLATPLALWALTISIFAVGTTEFVIVGLIPTIAADLGVSLPSAGLFVSLYALGVTIGAPVLTALTARLPRKTLLLSLLVPVNLPQGAAPGLRAQARVLTAPRYLITAICYGSNFVAFTYLAPMLTDVTGFRAISVSVIILLYGASVAAGNILGGKLSIATGRCRRSQ
ncbi:MFS transporter [Sulfitobacter sp. AS92]|uniref:MFS transporter n=1 Tax=Sulfitobacter sp. AS92 TaxID=3135783 RepID=UPI00318012E2